MEKLEPFCQKSDNVYATQVKEKFGSLRFYMSSAPDEAYDLIDEAEKKSHTICEMCGAPGERKRSANTRWISTRCAEHEI